MAEKISSKIVDVAVGLILREDGTLLLGDRPMDKPWPGWWELPGGKLEPGETVMQALARELDEELGIQVTRATPWITYVHAYPHTTVRLAFCRVTGWEGEPRGLEGQKLGWLTPQEALATEMLLPAALPPLNWMQLPERYAVTAIGEPGRLPAFLQRLDAALAAGLKLVQLREPGWPGGPGTATLHDAMGQVLARCRAAGARLLVNSAHPPDWWREADGVHLRAADAALLAERPALPGAQALVGVSAHDADELRRAGLLKADFAVLGPVAPTASHPGQAGMGWARFAELNRHAGLPVFAIGGQSPDTEEQAREHGAHGIAGIRGLY